MKKVVLNIIKNGKKLLIIAANSAFIFWPLVGLIITEKAENNCLGILIFFVWINKSVAILVCTWFSLSMISH